MENISSKDLILKGFIPTNMTSRSSIVNAIKVVNELRQFKSTNVTANNEMNKCQSIKISHMKK